MELFSLIKHTFRDGDLIVNMQNNVNPEIESLPERFTVFLTNELSNNWYIIWQWKNIEGFWKIIN